MACTTHIGTSADGSSRRGRGASRKSMLIHRRRLATTRSPRTPIGPKGCGEMASSSASSASRNESHFLGADSLNPIPFGRNAGPNMGGTGHLCPRSEVRLLYFGAQRCRIWRSDAELMLIHCKQERLQRRRRSARTRRADGGCWLGRLRRPRPYPLLSTDSTSTLRPATSIGDSDRISDREHSVFSVDNKPYGGLR